jgi:uncharacterized protein (DUF2235 family)
MKNIAILLDGTWNTSDSKYPSNVVKTAQLLTPSNRAGMAQVVYYDRGVGSVNVTIGSRINNWLGGAFGAGLMTSIEDAYRFLCFNYAPRDRIFIFGFSRGAFGARSLGGLIRYCGILRKDEIGRVKEAVTLYKTDNPEDDAVATENGQSRADAPRFLKFRKCYSIASPTSEYDRAERLRGDGDAALAIDYMGIWDTVGALGIPLGLGIGLASLFNRRYKFHDTSLSDMVRSARHAVAIDERRITFNATLWDNIDKLNAGVVASGLAAHARPYQQQWFPGDHGTVGGSGEVNGHWQSSLAWIVDGAVDKELGVDTAMLELYRNSIDPKASVRSMHKWVLSAANFSPYRWRLWPDGARIDAVSEHAKARVRLPADQLHEKRLYRPKPLRAVIPDILADASKSDAASYTEGARRETVA